MSNKYKSGTKVSHSVYGFGKIKNSKPEGENYILDVVFEDGNSRVLLSPFIEIISDDSVEEIKKSSMVELIQIAKDREEYLDFDEAIKIYEQIGKPEEAKRVRKLKAEQGSVKVEQTVVHGDYVDDRDTIIKDSVINRSNVGAGSDDKIAKLEKITEMKEKCLIDDGDYEKMKREIIG